MQWRVRMVVYLSPERFELQNSVQEWAACLRELAVTFCGLSYTAYLAQLIHFCCVLAAPCNRIWSDKKKKKKLKKHKKRKVKAKREKIIKKENLKKGKKVKRKMKNKKK
eukprot:TRINITY_DN30080_c1_g1_i2.p2 TRINITY_DN30080_c1_g1~~TRINITY_DN30080_c1_g1_i2.p2  ORF type:complete len:109 (+),score=7.04 TRINITY_DN30080_c1_g1_i2:383-709(+)